VILAIDTALAACAAAVLPPSGPAVTRSEPMQRGHAERLAPLVQELMAEAGAEFRDLERIAVTVGPGSFTGLRVGISFARALALALQKPCIGVSTLEALAGHGAGPRAGVIEAPGGVYVGVYRDGAPIVAPRQTDVSELADLLPAGCVVRGPGAGVCAAPVFAGLGLMTDALAGPDPEVVARLASGRASAEHPPVPQYLRSPDAKLPSP
jgi:tRNA threonylcarbamoyladenosine biosynthesis protein TsaB